MSKVARKKKVWKILSIITQGFLPFNYKEFFCSTLSMVFKSSLIIAKHREMKGTNQKIVVAISIIAIVLSLINLTTLFLPKSENGSIDLFFSSTHQSLYVANVTFRTRDSDYILFVVNPTNEAHLFTSAIVLIGTSYPQYQGFFSKISRYFADQNVHFFGPHTAYNVTGTLDGLDYAPKVRISLLDEFEGFVFSETLDVIKQS